MKLTMILELPENFPLTEELVEDNLEPGRTLSGELKVRVYLELGEL